MESRNAILEHFGLRLPIYAFTTALAARLLLEVSLFGAREGALHPILREDGPVEWLQIALIASATGVLLWRGRATAALLFGLGMLGIASRELDRVFEHLAFDGAHRVLMIGCGVGAALVAWRRRTTLRGDLAAFTRRPSFALMLFGAALLLGYAQAFGDRELFRMLAPEQTSAAKRFVEEGLEMLGYLWLLFAAVEERWSTRASAYPSP